MYNFRTLRGEEEGEGGRKKIIKKKKLISHLLLIEDLPLVITAATRQGGSGNFIATALSGLPTPQLGWFGGWFFFLFFSLFFFLIFWKSGKQFLHQVTASGG